MSDLETAINVLARGDRVILRDRLPSDLDSFIRWHFHGEHLKLDAPWGCAHAGGTEEQIEKIKEDFLERLKKELPIPRGSAIIATKDYIPIGTLNRYYQNDIKDAPFIGISIKEDKYLNQGLGTEAFKLWLDYQFSNSNVHRIGTETWSFNPRAIRMVEKVGFKLEGVQREIQEWEGKRLNKMLYGMLRREWQQGKL